MSGHSKWSNIKHKKEAEDKKKGEQFTRIASEIMLAVRSGGGNTNPETNSYLRSVMEKAREINMPKENVERLLKRYEARKESLVSFTLEGFGPFGVPVLLEVETDNKNRTLAEVKTVFKNFDGSLGKSGSVSFLFDRVGEVRLKSLPPEKQLELIDAGAIDIKGLTVEIRPDDLAGFLKEMDKLGIGVEGSRVIMKPNNPIDLDKAQRQKISELVAKLKENEDISNVFVGIN